MPSGPGWPFSPSSPDVPYKENNSSNFTLAMSCREAHGQKRFGSVSHVRSCFSWISFLPLWTRIAISTLEPQIIHVYSHSKVIQTAHVHSFSSGRSGSSFLSFVTIDPQESLQDYCKFRVGYSWWARDVQFSCVVGIGKQSKPM
jgi:hypothetical protein